MNSIRCALVVVVLIAGATACETDTQSAAPKADKSLIEIGFDAPTPDYLRAHVTAMEQQPFAGTMVNLHAGKTIFNNTAYPDSAYTQDRQDLAATKFTTLTDNFITIWSARQAGWDWFDEQDWAATETNAHNFAVTAKAGRFAGFIFDPSTSFATVQAKVRERGARFLDALQREIPDVRVMTLFGVSQVKRQAEERDKLEDADWVLLASFIDGMLDVINPHAQLIDGNEMSYFYTTPQDFDNWHAYKQQARNYVSPENRVKYDAQVTEANAVFADGLLNLYQSPRFFGYYLNDDLERRQMVGHNTYHALRSADRYAWVYNENMDWWGSKGKGVQLPDGLGDTLRNALRDANTGQPNRASVNQFIGAAISRFDAKVTIAGRVTQAGQGVGDVMLISGAPTNGLDPSCQPSRPDGYFGCTMPSGWTGTIVPSKPGLIFDPPQLTKANVTATIDDANLEARLG
jgi:hypothetical protein